MKTDHKTLVLASLGGMLEIYEFVIFVFFALTLSNLFFPVNMPQWLRVLQSYGIFVAGYVARPLGGVILAHFADLWGRKRVFSLSILMMAIPCLCTGFLPTYHDIGIFAPLFLLLFRIIQGAAVGGEVPSAWVFVAEHMSRARQGHALGVLQAGLTVGYLLGALTAFAIAVLVTPKTFEEFAWRIPFVLAGMGGVVGVWLRKSLVETPIFLAMRDQCEYSIKYPLGYVLRRHKKATVVAMLLTCVLTTAVDILVVVTPTIMQQSFGFSASLAFGSCSIGMLCLNLGCVIGGCVADRMGGWRSVAFYSALMPVAVFELYLALVFRQPEWTVIAYAVCGLCGGGVVGAIPAVIVNFFPAPVRVSGISLSYNISYSVWGSLSPLILIAVSFFWIWSVALLALIIGFLGVILALYGHREAIFR